MSDERRMVGRPGIKWRDNVGITMEKWEKTKTWKSRGCLTIWIGGGVSFEKTDEYLNSVW